MNGCRACGIDLTSTRLFDAHRVGTHQYLYAEGLKFDPPVEDGRRCLTADEMTTKGWKQNEKGQWYDPERVRAARDYFGEAAS